MEQTPFPHNVKRVTPPNINPRFLVLAGVVLILGALVWNMWFTVPPENVGVVLRFGRYVREAKPGLNFKLPDPVETVIQVPVQRQLKEEFGFRTKKAGVRTSYSKRDYKGESLMLTGDLNVVVVEWITQYRISDPYKLLFKVRDPRMTFRDMNEAVMREVVGDKKVDQVLTTGRQQIADEVKQRLQRLCRQYHMGITVDQVVLQDVNPPDPVKPSFNEVNQAQQEREKLINQAMSEYNRIIPKAKGEALRLIQQAEGYATERINKAKGDAAFFEALAAAYRQAPEVTQERIYLETMESVLPRFKDKTVIDSKLEGLLPLLQLDKGGKK